MSKTRFFGNLIKTNPTLPTANSSSAYGTATGIWTLEEAGAFFASGDWPVPASAPGAPTITGVTAGNAQVAVAFNANASTGGLDVTSFTALASSGQSASASSSPITVTGLTNGTAITFTVTATNAVGASSASSASNSVTPIVGAARGLFCSGAVSGGNSNVIDYITISSTGNATDFGDARTARSFYTGGASGTRAIFSQEYQGYDYITIASTGNAANFGSANASTNAHAGSSNNTRYLIWGGFNGSTSQTNERIEYVTIATTGNGTDFGDMNESTLYNAAAGGETRAVCSGGQNIGGAGSEVNTISYVTIGSTGNDSDFGDMSHTKAQHGCTTNNTRVLFIAGLKDGFSNTNQVEYVTLASTGNASDFGDLSSARRDVSNGNVTSTTRAISGGGSTTSSVNVIDYFTYSSTGNATDFGDLTVARNRHGGASTFGGT